MATPRKFSEKIALHNQKQAEETAKFEEIMKEVSVVTAKVCSTGLKTRDVTRPEFTTIRRKQHISNYHFCCMYIHTHNHRLNVL